MMSSVLVLASTGTDTFGGIFGLGFLVLFMGAYGENPYLTVPGGLLMILGIVGFTAAG